MKNTDIGDTLFLQAVEAIDSGDTVKLEDLIATHPYLVKDRLRTTDEGYFKDPYLLWFVADNPIRIDKMPANVLEVTQTLVQAVKREAPDTYNDQITYALALVATGRIPRECDVQTAMMDLLIEAGATPGGVIGALANGSVGAALHLVKRGAQPTFAAAVCLELADDIDRLGVAAGPGEKLTAMTAAAFYGKTAMIRLLLAMGTDPNGYPENNSGFHSHGTPLHQAVSSGSLDAVRLLVEAGARLDMPDKIYNGTPPDWARHMQTGDDYDEERKRKFALIEAYLQEIEPAK